MLRGHVKNRVRGSSCTLADQLTNEETIQRFFVEESVEFKKRIIDLKLRLEEVLSQIPEFEEEFKNHHEELTAIKIALAENITTLTESFAETVKLLRSDVNTLLDHGTQQNSNFDVKHETRNIKFNSETGRMTHLNANVYRFNGNRPLIVKHHSR